MYHVWSKKFQEQLACYLLMIQVQNYNTDYVSKFVWSDLCQNHSARTIPGRMENDCAIRLIFGSANRRIKVILGRTHSNTE